MAGLVPPSSRVPSQWAIASDGSLSINDPGGTAALQVFYVAGTGFYADGNGVVDVTGANSELGRFQSGGVETAKLDSRGAVVALHAAPGGAALANGEMAIWFDQAPGSTRLMIQAKDSAGTLKSGSVALA